tara:strand:- start:1220 stop:1453 length:234 start_codon:yes stop_codon:yes gene_type:complete
MAKNLATPKIVYEANDDYSTRIPKLITNWKIDSDGTLTMYIGDKLYNTFFDVDSIFEAQILVKDENLKAFATWNNTY